MINNEKDLIETITALANSKPKEYQDFELIRLKVREYLKQFGQDPDTINVMYFYQLEENITRPIIESLLGPVENELTKSKLYFIYTQYDFISHHITKLIKRLDKTSSCESDKARFIIKEYIGYLLKQKSEDWPAEKDRKYHQPKNKNKAFWIDFMDSLYDLYCGENEKYLKCLKDAFN